MQLRLPKVPLQIPALFLSFNQDSHGSLLGPYKAHANQRLCLSLLSQVGFQPLNACVAWRLLSLFKEFMILSCIKPGLSLWLLLSSTSLGMHTVFHLTGDECVVFRHSRIEELFEMKSIFWMPAFELFSS